MSSVLLMPVQFIGFGTDRACINPCCCDNLIAAEVLIAYCELEQSSSSANFTLWKEHRSQISRFIRDFKKKCSFVNTCFSSSLTHLTLLSFKFKSPNSLFGWNAMVILKVLGSNDVLIPHLQYFPVRNDTLKVFAGI